MCFEEIIENCVLAAVLCSFFVHAYHINILLIVSVALNLVRHS